MACASTKGTRAPAFAGADEWMKRELLCTIVWTRIESSYRIHDAMKFATILK